MHQNFENVKAGDKLITKQIDYYGTNHQVVTVKRVTPTLIVIPVGHLDVKYRKKDGSCVASKSRTTLWVPEEVDIEKITQDQADKQEKSRLLGSMIKQDWYKVSLDQLRRIRTILDES